jgi:hypothetical protein
MREKALSYNEQDPNRSGNGGRTLEKCENSLVISWLGMGVARVLRMNASVPMVGWEDEHPQSVSWRKHIIDNRFPTLCNLAVTMYELVILCMFQELCIFLNGYTISPLFLLGRITRPVRIYMVRR